MQLMRSTHICLLLPGSTGVVVCSLEVASSCEKNTKMETTLLVLSFVPAGFMRAMRRGVKKKEREKRRKLEGRKKDVVSCEEKKKKERVYIYTKQARNKTELLFKQLWIEASQSCRISARREKRI